MKQPSLECVVSTAQQTAQQPATAILPPSQSGPENKKSWSQNSQLPSRLCDACAEGQRQPPLFSSTSKRVKRNKKGPLPKEELHKMLENLSTIAKDLADPKVLVRLETIPPPEETEICVVLDAGGIPGRVLICNFLTQKEEEGILSCVEHVFETMGANAYLYGNNYQGFPLHIQRLDLRHSQGTHVYSPEGYIGARDVPGNLVVDVLLQMFVGRLHRVLKLATQTVTPSHKLTLAAQKKVREQEQLEKGVSVKSVQKARVPYRLFARENNAAMHKKLKKCEPLFETPPFSVRTKWLCGSYERKSVIPPMSRQDIEIAQRDIAENKFKFLIPPIHSFIHPFSNADNADSADASTCSAFASSCSPPSSATSSSSISSCSTASPFSAVRALGALNTDVPSSSPFASSSSSHCFPFDLSEDVPLRQLLSPSFASPISTPIVITPTSTCVESTSGTTTATIATPSHFTPQTANNAVTTSTSPLAVTSSCPVTFTSLVTSTISSLAFLRSTSATFPTVPTPSTAGAPTPIIDTSISTSTTATFATTTTTPAATPPAATTTATTTAPTTTAPATTAAVIVSASAPVASAFSVTASSIVTSSNTTTTATPASTSTPAMPTLTLTTTTATTASSTTTIATTSSRTPPVNLGILMAVSSAPATSTITSTPSPSVALPMPAAAILAPMSSTLPVTSTTVASIATSVTNITTAMPSSAAIATTPATADAVVSTAAPGSSISVPPPPPPPPLQRFSSRVRDSFLRSYIPIYFPALPPLKVFVGFELPADIRDFNPIQTTSPTRFTHVELSKRVHSSTPATPRRVGLKVERREEIADSQPSLLDPPDSGCDSGVASLSVTRPTRGTGKRGRNFLSNARPVETQSSNQVSSPASSHKKKAPSEHRFNCNCQKCISRRGGVFRPSESREHVLPRLELSSPCSPISPSLSCVSAISETSTLDPATSAVIASSSDIAILSPSSCSCTLSVPFTSPSNLLPSDVHVTEIAPMDISSAPPPTDSLSLPPLDVLSTTTALLPLDGDKDCVTKPTKQVRKRKELHWKRPQSTEARPRQKCPYVKKQIVATPLGVKLRRATTVPGQTPSLRSKAEFTMSEVADRKQKYSRLCRLMRLLRSDFGVPENTLKTIQFSDCLHEGGLGGMGQHLDSRTDYTGLIMTVSLIAKAMLHQVRKRHPVNCLELPPRSCYLLTGPSRGDCEASRSHSECSCCWTHGIHLVSERRIGVTIRQHKISPEDTPKQKSKLDSEFFFWARCDVQTCRKWRKLPPGYAAWHRELGVKGEQFVCFMSPDLTKNACSIEEEPYSADEGDNDD